MIHNYRKGSADGFVLAFITIIFLITFVIHNVMRAAASNFCDTYVNGVRKEII